MRNYSPTSPSDVVSVLNVRRVASIPSALALALFAGTYIHLLSYGLT